MKYVAVMVCGFVLGGWAVPLGFIVGLGPIATFAAAAGGGLLGCWAFLLAGDRIAARFHRSDRARPTSAASVDPETATATRGPSGPADDADAGRIARFVDRYGVRGLGLIGPIFPGVTASVVGGLALGLDRRSLGRWMTVGIVVVYGLYVLGLALLVRLF